MLLDLIDNINRNLRSVVLWVCGLLLLGVWFAQVNPYLNAADDSGRYVILGQSLSRNGDLRLINQASAPLDTLYPPAYPAIIATWLKVTGNDLNTTVKLVKTTQIVLMLFALPLLFNMLTRARLRWPYVVGAMFTFALSPTIAGYANEVMSDCVFLFLVFISIYLVQDSGQLKSAEPNSAQSNDGEPEADDRGRRHSGEDDKYPTSNDFWEEARPAIALGAAALSFLVRTSGIALLLTLTVWYWRRLGAKWGIAALLTTMVFVGGWQLRNHEIVKSHPEIHYSTYLDQFSLRQPENPAAGRIALTPIGLLGRAYHGFPTYIGMIPRTLLYAMAPSGSVRLIVFYLAAVPTTLLVFVGLWEAWRRDLKLMIWFSIVFWLFAAMWPWRNARFIVPLIPFILTFLFLGLEVVIDALKKQAGKSAAKLAAAAFAAVVLIHFIGVDVIHIHDEHRPIAAGFGFGRTPSEGGFYAACDWLAVHADLNAVVMGRPAYLVSIYSGRPSVQIEPTSSPRSMERNYIERQNVRYILFDAWSWSKSRRYLGPYLQQYGPGNWIERWPVDSQAKKSHTINAGTVRTHSMDTTAMTPDAAAPPIDGGGVTVWERIMPKSSSDDL